MIHAVEKIFETGDNPIAPVFGLMYLRSPIAGKIKSFRLWWSSGTSTSQYKLDIRLNGVSQYPLLANMLTLNTGNSFFDSKTGLNITVARGDIILVDLRQSTGTALNSPGVFVMEIDDEIPFTGNLDDLDDVVITSPADGETLIYDTGNWVNGPAPASALDDLSDVILTGPSAGQVLTFDGSDWVNDDPTGGGGGGGLFSPDTPYASPDAVDDDFDAGSLDGKWATANGASTIHTDFSLDNHVGVYCVEGNFNGLKQSTSNVDQSIRAKFRSAKDGSGTVVLGLFFKGGSNNIVEYVFQGATYNFYKGVYTGGVASSGAFTGVSGGAFFNDLNHFQEFWLELKYTASGHTVDGLISLDGVQFYPMFTAQDLGANVTEMGISVHGSSTLYSYIDWFRKLQGSFTGGNN